MCSSLILSYCLLFVIIFSLLSLEAWEEVCVGEWVREGGRKRSNGYVRKEENGAGIKKEKREERKKKKEEGERKESSEWM